MNRQEAKTRFDEATVDYGWPSVGASVEGSIWAYVGSLFPCVQNWMHIDHAPGEYPYAAGAELWRRGFVPVYYQGKWKLFSGENAVIVWEDLQCFKCFPLKLGDSFP